MKSDIGRVDGNNYEASGNRFDLENSGIQQCGSEEITTVEALSGIGVENGSKNAVDSSCVGGESSQLPDEGSMKPGTESGAGGVAGTGTGKRKILKKTVRIVKKVIKKRVPKRVLINRKDIRGEVVKVEDGINLSEVRTNANLTDDVIEKSNVADEVFEKTDRVNEAKDTINTSDDVTENLNIVNDVDMIKDKPSIVHDVDMIKDKPSIVHDVLEEEDIRSEVLQNLEIGSAPNVSGPVTSEEVDDLSAHMESEMLKPVTDANVSEEMVPRNDPSGLYSMDADGMKRNDDLEECEVDGNNLTKHCRDLEVDKAKFTPGTINERENTMTENQLKDCNMENQRIDIVNKVDMELLSGQSVGPMRVESVVLSGKENERSTVKAESCSDEVNSGLLLSSEEMEALERKKKRKIDIFLGGLSKDTKEEDIRKVFEDVGSVVEVRLVVNPKTGKNRGYAFVQFATAADAKNALAKYSQVEICGKLCNAAPVEGNDTIFLRNIDRNWKTEDLVKLLVKAGIEKIDKVTLKADPNNTERNRGFAFVELQTSKDAQTAFKKLQQKDAFGKNQMVKVAWAQPLNEPSEEKISQVKSVYAEYIPSSWDEEKVKEYFKRFGEIESVVLAKDLSSSRRKDIAFIYYTTRDAALTCIEAVNRERLGDDCSKVKMAVSLAKPIPERKQMRHSFKPTTRQHLEAKENTLQTSKKVHGPRNKGKAARSSYDHVKVVNRHSTTSTTEELVQLLRQQALTKHNLPHRGSGAFMPDHRFLSPGSKRPFSQVGQDPLYVESQGLSRVRVESSYRFSGPSSLSNGVDLLLPPYHHHQMRPGFPSESISGRRNYSSPLQTRDRASYYEDTNLYHRN